MCIKDGLKYPESTIVFLSFLKSSRNSLFSKKSSPIELFTFGKEFNILCAFFERK